MSDYFVNFNKLEDTGLIFSNSATFGQFSSGESILVAFWIKMSTLPEGENQYIAYNYDTSSGFMIYLDSTDTGYMNVRVSIKFTGASIVEKAFQYVLPQIGIWQCFSILFEQNGSIRLWVNNVLHFQSYLLGNGTINNTGPLYIGRTNNNAVIERLNASVDGFAILKGLTYANSVLFVSQYYNKGRGTKIKSSFLGIIFGLNFDEGSGVNTLDEKHLLVGSFPSDIDENLLWGEGGTTNILSPSDIKIYLTSLEPYIEQANYSQSIGGYVSESLVYPETTLLSNLSIYGLSMTVNLGENFSLWQNIRYVNINGEIIKVSVVDSQNIRIEERSINDRRNMHISGEPIRAISSINLFNNLFNSNYKQYRCYAVKNNSSNALAYSLQVYFKNLNQDVNTDMKIAIELPKSQFETGITSEWSSSTMVDSSLSFLYDDNYFKECYVSVLEGPNSGEKRRVSSYDGATGTFVFYDSLGVDYDEEYSINISYSIDPAPCQRITDGTISPVLSIYLSSFVEATEGSPLDVSLTGLNPNDIFYIWVERNIRRGNVLYNDDYFLIDIKYNVKA